MAGFPDFITGLPELDVPIDGVTGYVLQGENQQVAFLNFAADADVPEHSHRAQWEHVIAGQVELRMQGKRKTYRQGQSFYIPEGVEHGAFVHSGYSAIVFFDQADRYKTK